MKDILDQLPLPKSTPEIGDAESFRRFAEETKMDPDLFKRLADEPLDPSKYGLKLEVEDTGKRFYRSEDGSSLTIFNYGGHGDWTFEFSNGTLISKFTESTSRGDNVTVKLSHYYDQVYEWVRGGFLERHWVSMTNWRYHWFTKGGSDYTTLAQVFIDKHKVFSQDHEGNLQTLGDANGFKEVYEDGELTMRGWSFGWGKQNPVVTMVKENLVIIQDPDEIFIFEGSANSKEEANGFYNSAYNAEAFLEFGQQADGYNRIGGYWNDDPWGDFSAYSDYMKPVGTIKLNVDVANAYAKFLSA